MNILQMEYFKYALKLHKSKQINEMAEKKNEVNIYKARQLVARLMVSLWNHQCLPLNK